jgi:hypothetical protein
LTGMKRAPGRPREVLELGPQFASDDGDEGQGASLAVKRWGGFFDVVPPSDASSLALASMVARQSGWTGCPPRRGLPANATRSGPGVFPIS